MTKILCTTFILCLLTACGNKLSGKYTSIQPKNMAGMLSLEFTSGEKVILDVMGARSELAYSIEGKNLKLENGNANQLFTLQDDGSITTTTGMMGNVVLKKE